MPSNPTQNKQILTVTLNPDVNWQFVAHALRVRPDHIHVRQLSGDQPVVVSDGSGMGDPPPTSMVFGVKYNGIAPAKVTFLVEYWHSLTGFRRDLFATHPTLVTYSSGGGDATNQYVDVRLVGSNAWRGMSKFGMPIDDLVNPDVDNLKLSQPNLFPGGIGGNQGIDCWEVNYPPYNGDPVKLGQRIDTGGAANDGAFVYTAVNPHGSAQTVLIYWNELSGTDWDLPAHQIRINRVSGGVVNPYIPRMIVPPGAHRALLVMEDGTVISGAAGGLEPSSALDQFPLYVPPSDSVICPPLEFFYDHGTDNSRRAPCKRLQDQNNGQRINTNLYARMNMEQNIVCGDPAKNGMAVALLSYNFAPGPAVTAMVAMDARSCEYDGSAVPEQWVQLTPVTGSDEYIDAMGKVTPPGDNKLFTVKFHLGFDSLVSPPAELEFRFRRIGRHADDTAAYLNFLGGGYLAWFESPYRGIGMGP